MILRGESRPDLLRQEVLADILQYTAQTVPEQIALIDGFNDSDITYFELNRRADEVAHHLIERGVNVGDMIGLWLPRGMDLLVMQAGIAKAGAAWLPFDADVPVERIAVCLADASAVGLITADEWLAQLSHVTQAVWTADALSMPIVGDLKSQRAAPSDPAYVIYTSGSTGKPKGIMINQGSICHFLRSENSVLNIHMSDRVYQGFSVAFDMSFEEIWISYLVGATLWLAPKDVVSDPDAIVNALEVNEISVLHAVPTLLALLPRDVADLRLINLGGEMCPDSVVERWATPYRQLFNTYGPTEATVSASLAELKRGTPVTIGEPLPNYGLLVVNETLEILPIGEVGELCITGVGVAMGYLGRDDLTVEKFVPNPYAQNELESRLYRTGDLARIDEHGQIHCLGRADDQIKIRGFRVELGEIEAALCEQPNIGTAAVVVKNDTGVDQLIAFVVMDAAASLDVPTVRSALKKQMPAYMIPAQIIALDEMPRLLSGKIDRKALRVIETLPSNATDSDTPHSAVEIALFDALKHAFPNQAIQFQSDFFCDLGGHSLLAARVVSNLRHTVGLENLSVQVIYQQRTVAAIAQALSVQAAHIQTVAEPLVPPSASTLRRRVMCGVAQALTLPPLICLRMAQWLMPFFTYHYLTGDEDDSLTFAVLASLGVFLLTHIMTFVVVIVSKRVVFHRVKAGSYRLWGATYYRWWLFERLSEVPAMYLLASSSLYNLFLRALGATIGRDVMIGSVTVRVPHLCSIGAYADIGNGVNIENAHIEGENLILGEVHIGARAFVGSYGVLQSDTVIEDDGYLEGLSALNTDKTIAANQVWSGSPAVLVGERPKHHHAPRPAVSSLRLRLEPLYYFFGACLIAALFFIPVFPSFILIDYADENWFHLTNSDYHFLISAMLKYFLLGLPASLVLIVVMMLIAALLRRILMPKRMVADTHPVHSNLYYRKWLTNQIQEASLNVLHGLYATVYSASWFRLLGARIGRDAEISTAMGIVPDMLTLGDDSFIADGVMLGDEHIEGGWLTLRPTMIGNRSFIGNGAYVPDGRIVPDDVLIGVQTRCPPNAQLAQGQTWIGLPPMILPMREKAIEFDDTLTFRPTIARRMARGLIEALRIVLPMSLVITTGYFTVLEVVPYTDDEQWLAAGLMLALCGIVFGVGSFVFVWLLKWALIGRYKPHAVPMWTMFVWLSEAVTNMYESIAVPSFMNFLRGTPMLPWAFRAMGVNIGRGVFMDTTDITEYDCVSIGDYSILNARCGPQTHLFEDRIMKVGRVDIGNHVTVLPRSTILYDTVIGDGVHIGALSLILKGEQLPAQTRWVGTPAHND